MRRRIRGPLIGLTFGFGLSVAILGGLEFGMRALDIGPELRHDPFSGFARLVPMFVLHEDGPGGPVYRTHPGRAIKDPQEFRARKADNGFRAFVVGGSSAAGVPYPRELAFPGWLGKRLAASLPHRDIEVVNVALSGYASHRVLAVVQELVNYEPDLLIVYSGHNEFWERRYYAHLLDMPEYLFRFLTRLYRTRLFALLSQVSGHDGTSPEAAAPDFEHVRENKEMFAVPKDDNGERLVSAHGMAQLERLYRFNITSMVRVMREVGAQTLLLSLTQNFADWQPGRSLHRADMTAEESVLWEEAFNAGRRAAAGGDCPQALVEWEHAREIDDQYAALHYEIATCLRAEGSPEAAHVHYVLANDLDHIPHRARSSFTRVLRDIADQEGALFLDIGRRVSDEAAKNGEYVGDSFVSDAMHPTIRTHQLIAAAVEEMLRTSGIPDPAEKWSADRAVLPTPAEIYASDGSLRERELETRVLACFLARKTDCALKAANFLLALNPDHPVAQNLVRALQPEASASTSN